MSESADTMNKAMDLALKVTAVIMAGVALYEAVNALTPASPKALPDGNQLKLDLDAEASEDTL